MPRRPSPIKEKILLLLFAGISIGLSRSFVHPWRIFGQIPREWRKIDRKVLAYEIRQLYKSHLIERRDNADDSTTLFLTDKGKMKALTFHFASIKILNPQWDKKWRVVIFDIPERLRKGRDALREKLLDVGFMELQKSVFVFPYECQNEVEFIIEFFNLRKFVRFGILESIDNDPHLKERFNLI